VQARLRRDELRELLLRSRFAADSHLLANGLSSRRRIKDRQIGVQIIRERERGKYAMLVSRDIKGGHRITVVVCCNPIRIK
jgi:hypothetical protein